MKAIKGKSVASHLKRTSTRVSFSPKGSECGSPTPKDFDSFVPWVCCQFQVPRLVIVNRLTQEPYLPRTKILSTTKSKLKGYLKKQPESTVSDGKKEGSSVSGNVSVSTDMKNAIHLTTYYNTKGQLVEVAFINCPFNIHRKVVHAISICLPFHPAFYKFTIKGGGLTQMVLYEISKFLPYSYITDISLDDNYVPEGNYHLILEKENHLQNLSLRRCRINDRICKEIADNLNYGAPASKTLLTLDLTSNRISDIGAQALGKILRTNRTLLHLNLADNHITDAGAFYILNNLHLFLLNDDDIFELKHRYVKYCFEKVKIYKQCEKETICRLKEEQEKKNRLHIKRLTEISKNEERRSRTPSRRLTEITRNRKSLNHGTLFIEELSIIEQTEKMTKEIIGEFKDIFDDNNIRYKHDKLYAIGNLKLCSLNFAYNNLGYLSVKKVYEILKYQNQLAKQTQYKGLLRVILDGNNIPRACKELTAIESFLEIAVTESVSISELNRSASAIKSFRKLQQK